MSALYYEIEENVFIPWIGQEINETKHPLNIASCWLDEELAEIGLYKPAPADPVPFGFEVSGYEVSRVNGVVKIINHLKPKDMVTEYSRAILGFMDEKAQQFGYDSILSAVSYKGSSNVKWSQEGHQFCLWRNLIWDYAYAEFEKVQNLQRSIPTVEEFLSELPEFKV